MGHLKSTKRWNTSKWSVREIPLLIHPSNIHICRMVMADIIRILDSDDRYLDEEPGCTSIPSYNHWYHPPGNDLRLLDCHNITGSSIPVVGVQWNVHTDTSVCTQSLWQLLPLTRHAANEYGGWVKIVKTVQTVSWGWPQLRGWQYNKQQLLVVLQLISY